MDKLAHTVEEYQPTGYTLSSTKVCIIDNMSEHELLIINHWLILGGDQSSIPTKARVTRVPACWTRVACHDV